MSEGSLLAGQLRVAGDSLVHRVSTPFLKPWRKRRTSAERGHDRGALMSPASEPMNSTNYCSAIRTKFGQPALCASGRFAGRFYRQMKVL